VPSDPTTYRVTAAETIESADLPLVRRAQAGDLDAFGELVERNRRAVFRAALAAVGSATEAEDVAQDAFVTAFQKLGTFRGEAAFRTWLLAITWRKAIDRRKSVMRWMKRMVPGTHQTDEGSEWDAMEQLPATERSQEDVLVASDLQRQVRELIATLPRKLRDALLLATCGDYSYEQVGSMLGIPVGTVKWRVSEARRVLKMKLGERQKTDRRQKTEEGRRK
jgi:RNA polymerase sigma-70 factor, ECF subfamily